MSWKIVTDGEVYNVLELREHKKFWSRSVYYSWDMLGWGTEDGWSSHDFKTLAQAEALVEHRKRMTRPERWQVVKEMEHI
jgi:hypothetical protein